MHLGWDCLFTLVPLAVCVAAPPTPAEDHAVWKSPTPNHTDFMREAPPTGPWISSQREFRPGARYEPTIWRRGIYESIQVNVDNYGQNIPGDAANEPSLAVDPTDPNKMVFGWRQFASETSGAREAGWAFSQDAGEKWVFGGSLTPGAFGSDPVLRPNADGVFYYLSLGSHDLRFFRSFDGAISWVAPTQVVPFFLDKPWMTVDRTAGVGRGNIYVIGSYSRLIRSVDGGDSFREEGTSGPFTDFKGTLTVGPDGALYAVNINKQVARSDDAQDITVTPSWCAMAPITGTAVAIQDETYGFSDKRMTYPLGAAKTSAATYFTPNPDGLDGQPWIATDHSMGPLHGHVYVLDHAWLPVQGARAAHVWFVRSNDRGWTWSNRIPISPASLWQWQWFGMMDVAPNGRIDALWNDTRNTGVVNLSELHYSFSLDGGENWSPAVAVSPVFDSWVGWPSGNRKLGDYYDLTSDSRGVNVAYAATFNGEQDIYFLRIEQDCNGNEVPDHVEIAKGYAADCNDNLIPDECETFGDCTCDWIVTLADHAAFVECLTGPALPPYQGGIEGGSSTRTDDGTAPHQHRDRYGAVPRDRSLSLAVLIPGGTGPASLPPACLCADSHRDGAVDLADFARLQRFLTAP